MARVLMLAQDVVGAAMAGPAIRYWELSSVLSERHEVTLAMPNPPERHSDRFQQVQYGGRRTEELVESSDVVISQACTPSLARWIRRSESALILDAYDPLLIEALESHYSESLLAQEARNRLHLRKMVFGLLAADAVICASERQRDLWIGALMALGRVSPDRYLVDRDLRQFVSVIPFGVQPPPSSKLPMKNLRDRLGANDESLILLWGGGIWNWFDPTTVIKAVKKLRDGGLRVELVFMGLRHPNPMVREEVAADLAVRTAYAHDLVGAGVRFNFGWVPYEERAEYLLGSDIGVSAHFAHLEARYSFRTRLLDYFWAGLPTVTTEGDHLAEVIRDRRLGEVVPCEDVSGFAAAVASLAEPQRREQIKAALRPVADEYSWKTIGGKLADLVDAVAASELRSRPPSVLATADLLATGFIDVTRRYGVRRTIQRTRDEALAWMPRWH